jgi:two-component system LytT family sensor kinase
VSDLLRLALDGAGRPERTLKEELDFVDRYLEVERARFQDRLKVVRAVESEALEAEVPSMLLQPVVENSIRHGIEPRAAGGTVTLSARREGEVLALSIRDDGAGFDAATPRPGAGTGLKNLRSRLEQLFPGRHRLELTTPPGGGAEVRISLPFRSRRGS